MSQVNENYCCCWV